MQFSKSATGALALLFFALPAIAAKSNSPEKPTGNVASGRHVPVPTAQEAQQIATELKQFGSTIETELKSCINVPGENTAECFNRAKGMNIPKGKIMTQSQIDAATLKYSKLVGKLLGDCSKAKGFYPCLELVKKADDKKEFSFSKRGFGTDFMHGFVKGFTGTFQAAKPILEMVLPYI